MKTQCLVGMAIFLLFSCVMAAESVERLPLESAIEKTGQAYKGALSDVLAATGVTNEMEKMIKTEPSTSQKGRMARIILARIQHPDVFSDCEAQIEKWRKEEKRPSPRVDRPGLFSGMLFEFTKRGPESRFVDERVRDKNGKVVYAPFPGTENGGKLKAIRAVYKKVEKYTDAEVQVGIARNAAARQAVLERFMKFLDEGDAYEQSEMVDLIHRLWGSTSSERREDEPLADDLIEAVYKDESRPLLARYAAALRLPVNSQQGIQAFMLNLVTNSQNQSEDLVNRALSHLESSADANTLAVLKNQTNGPDWKREKVEKTSHAIESRLSATTKDK